MVGGTPRTALAAMPTRLGTSRCVNVIVPIFPGGMSRPLPAAFGAAYTDVGPSPASAATAAAPPP
jgi:hypothetical protein